MIAELDAQINMLTVVRQRLVAAGAMINAALARGQDIAQEVLALRQALVAEDTAPLDAGTRLAVIDVSRERRNRQETAAARLIALRQELIGRRAEIVNLLTGDNDGPSAG